MKKRIIVGFFLLLLLAAAGLTQQEEIILKELGRAPLSPYLQSPADVRVLLGRVNEKLGRALEVFPGGALGEELYAILYEKLSQLQMERIEVYPGQKMIWMLYSKGRLLRNLKWEGQGPFQAYKFEIKTEDKIFIFVVPVRCGNIALLEMKEAPAEKPAEKPIIVYPPVIHQKPAPQTPSPAVPISKNVSVPHWAPTLKIKFGGGWGRMQLPAPVEYTSQFNFFSLILPDPADEVFYCNDGVAMWYYTHRDSTPFNVDQTILISQRELLQVQKGKMFPFYVGVEFEFTPKIFLTASFFQVGKYSLSQYEGRESMVIDEVRRLGQYNSSYVDSCPPTYVYYVGLHRERLENKAREDLKIKEFSAGILYQLKLSKKIFVTPEAGVTWQVRSGKRTKDTTYQKLYPFKEKQLAEEEVVYVEKKVKEKSTHPYVGMGLELGPVFVEGRRLFGGDHHDIVKISSWRVQGGILLKL